MRNREWWAVAVATAGLGMWGTGLGASDAGKPVKFTLAGTVRSENGQPVVGAEVAADNTLYYNMNVLGRTDAKGRYSITLPKGELGTWHGYATLTREYHGETYKFTLIPNNTAAFTAQQGAVRDFTWKLTGKTPSGGRYGGAFWIYRDVDAESFDLSRVEVTLVPDGPLIDGSKGRTIRAFWGDSQLDDLPIGRYRVTARYVPQNGAPRTVLLSGRRPTTYASTMTGTFQPARHTSGYLLEFTVRLGDVQSARSESANSRSISGSVRAGSDLKGTVVVACVEKGGECDESTQRATTITTSGQSARYQFDGLQAGVPYALYAWKDMNGDGKVGKGDLIGLYGADSGGQTVTAPRADADFTLSAMQ